MKILKVSPDGDYDALIFEQNFSGQKVSDFIDRVEKGEKITCDNDEEGEITINLKVVEGGEVDPKFLLFVRHEVQDEDDQKHSNFYLETELIP